MISIILSIIYLSVIGIFIDPLISTIFNNETQESKHYAQQNELSSYGYVYQNDIFYHFQEEHPYGKIYSNTTLNTASLSQAIYDNEISIGLSLDTENNILVMRNSDTNAFSTILAVNQFPKTIITQKLDNIQDFSVINLTQPFAVMISIFIGINNQMMTMLFEQFHKAQLEGRKQLIFLNGGSKLKWYIYHLVLVCIFMFCLSSVIISILAVMQVKFAKVNIIIWVFSFICYYLQNIVLVMLISKFTKSYSVFIQATQYSYLGQTILVIVLLFSNVNKNMDVIFSLIPQIALTKVINVMIYSAYTSHANSLFVYFFNFGIFYSILVQIVSILCLIAYIIYTDKFYFPTKKVVQVNQETDDQQLNFIDQQIRTEKFESEIIVYNLTKSYKKKVALQNLTLAIPRNIIYGILGGNGSGKTTLLNSIIQAHQIDSGSIIINGLQNSNQRHFGVCSQESNSIFEELYCSENINFYLKMYGTQNQNLLQFDLPQRQQAKTLSGGQRRLLQLQISLIQDPDILILDEPTAGMDPKNAKMLWDQLKKLNKTILCSSHLPDEINYFDEICCLDNGKTTLVGNVKQICKGRMKVRVNGKVQIVVGDIAEEWQRLSNLKKNGEIKEFSIKSLGMLDFLNHEADEVSILE